MELLNQDEIKVILNNFGNTTLINWRFEEFSEKVIGYLGDHLKLIIKVNEDIRPDIQLFVKCMPRFDKWKADYLKDLKFFMKEYIMLSSLFKQFEENEETKEWRPKLLFIRKDLFVFEDVSLLGYKMPHHRNTLTIDELQATVKTLARFHAQSFIFEERKSKELNRPYRIWEDYKEYLQEPATGQDWRDAGRNAAIDYLKVFSKYKFKKNFTNNVETVLRTLFIKALALMKPSVEYRNAVIHRDLWTNNIFIRKDKDDLDVMFVDFQTVLYSSPMLDLTSLIYLNTNKSDRSNHTFSLINLYYETLSCILENKGLNVDDIFPKDALVKSYNESIVFGATQAALIVPIIAMDSRKREEIFCDPDKCERANVVTRSNEIISTAMEDLHYRHRVTDLLDDIVEVFIYPD